MGKPLYVKGVKVEEGSLSAMRNWDEEYSSYSSEEKSGNL